MTQQPVLIHLHVPKTAGETLRYILSRHYRRSLVMHRVDALDLPAVPKETWATLTCITGHYPYGIHEYLEGRPYRYITMLREPISRVISTYYYMLRDTTHPGHQQLVDSGQSLDEWVERRENAALFNQQTSVLAGVFPAPSMTQELFESARDHLEHNMDSVGLTEDFDRSLMSYQKLMGWHNVLYVRQNVTSNRPDRSQTDPGTIQRIRDMNQLDLALYEIACSCHEREAHSISRAAVYSFQTMNRLYGVAVDVRDKLRLRARHENKR